MLYLFNLLLAMAISQIFLGLKMTLTIFRSPCQEFYMPSNQELSDVFLMDRQEEERRGKLPFSSRHIKSTYYQHDLCWTH